MTTPDLATSMVALTGFLAWLTQLVMSHPQQSFELLFITLPAIFAALHTRQWNKLLTLAGALTFQAAAIAELENEEKRRWVAMRLKDSLPIWLKPFFSQKMIDAAVEYGYRLIAKRNLPAVPVPSLNPVLTEAELNVEPAMLFDGSGNEVVPESTGANQNKSNDEFTERRGS